MQTHQVFPFNAQASEEQKGRGAKRWALTSGAAGNSPTALCRGRRGSSRDPCLEVENRFLAAAGCALHRGDPAGPTPTRPVPHSPAGSAQINTDSRSYSGPPWAPLAGLTAAFSSCSLFLSRSHGWGRSLGWHMGAAGEGQRLPGVGVPARAAPQRGSVCVLWMQVGLGLPTILQLN